MKGLSLLQPWATLVAIGAKQIETRSWLTNYRGPIAIQASKSPREVFEVEGRALWPDECPEDRTIVNTLKAAGYGVLPLGAIVATAELIDCRQITAENAPQIPELYFGDYTPGRYAWHLANVRRLPEPIPCKGALGLWTVPQEVEALITRGRG